jgi:hypothetical protein
VGVLKESAARGYRGAVELTRVSHTVSPDAWLLEIETLMVEAWLADT